MKRATPPLIATALLVAASASQAQAPARIDHHLHLNSPAITAFLPAYCAAVASVGGCDPR